MKKPLFWRLMSGLARERERERERARERDRDVGRRLFHQAGERLTPG